MEDQVQHRTTTSVRLRFTLEERTADIALPAEVALVDLLPAVLPQFGAEWVEQSADHEGWVVQRLGEAALDEDRTPAQLGLLDGETLHLRPRVDQLAVIDFDDVVDGVAEQVRSHPGSWTPARTRWMLRTGSVVVLLAGMPVLLMDGATTVPLALAGCLVLALLVGAALVARGGADSAAATVLVGVATAFAAFAGVLLVVVLHPAATPFVLLTAGAAGALVALTVGVVAVADASLLFAGAILFCVLLALTGLVGALAPVTPPGTAAICLTVTLIIGIFLPSAAFRLSGLTLPLLPTSATELTDDIEPVPARVVVERGAATVGYANALYLGMGAAQVVLVPVLVRSPRTDTWTTVLSLVMALLLLLRSRHPDGALQRWSMLVPAGLVVTANLLLFAAGLSPLDRLLAAWLPTVAVGIVLLLLAGTLPGRRLRPYWGRVVDILEWLTAVAVLPILLQVLGVYAVMRGLAG